MADIDVALFKDEDLFDFEWEDGDFKMTEGFDTAILMSFFGERRADVSESLFPQNRRGFAGNLLNENGSFEYGSKIWILYNARSDQDTVNRAETYAKNGFSWFVEDGLAQQVESIARLSALGVTVDIQVTRNDNEIESFSFNLWENTFAN